MDKKCGKCGIARAVEEFHKDRSKVDGLSTVCRTCKGCKPKDLLPPGIKRCGKCKEPKQFQEFSGGNRTKNGLQSWCKACTNRSSRAYAKALGSDGHRRNHLKYHYGISMEDFDKLIRGQHGLCAICRSPAAGDTHLVVDHDHNTGQVRGLLCPVHNTAIGLLRDDPNLLRAAAAYLEAPPATAILNQDFPCQ